MRRPFVLVAFGLLAGGLVSASWWYVHRVAPVELLHVALAPDAFARYTANIQAQPVPDIAANQPLLEAFFGLNRAEVEAANSQQGAKPVGRQPGGLPTPERAEGASPEPGGLPASESGLALRATAWESAVELYLNENTPDLFVALGRKQGLLFVDALGKLLAFCGSTNLTPERCLAERGDAPAVQAYVPLGGLFVQMAPRGGLMERVEDGAAWRIVPGREPLLLAVFLDHWGRAARRSQPVEGFFTADEVAWLNRWKAEFQLEGAVEKRVAAALELSTEPGYPAELNAGVLLYSAGRYAEALPHFRRAKEAEGALYARLAESAADTAAPAGPGQGAH